MHILALTISLLILGIACLFIFTNFFYLAFHWEDFLFFLVITVIVYLIVRACGNSLDKKFNNSITQFLDGKKITLFDDKRLLRIFGFLLITLLPFLIFLLAFALYSAITFSLYGFLLMAQSGRIFLVILIGLGIVAFGTGLAVLTGFYYLFFPPGRKVLGIEIKKDEQKRLWELTKSIANKIEAKPINKIVIKPDPGIGVYLEGGIFRTIFGGGKRVLEIGLPSTHELSIDEFGAILAHEYGHFSNRDTQWNSFTYSMGNSLLSTLNAVPGPQQEENSEEGGIIKGIMSLNPAYYILLFFANLFFRVTNGFSRVREVMADIMAISLYDGNTFSNALLKVATNDFVFSEIIQARFVPELLEKEQVITNFSNFIEAIYKQLEKSDADIANIKKVLFQSETHDIYDSHPTLKIRLDYAKKFGTTKKIEEKLISSLFDNWDELNQKVAELYNFRLLLYMRALSGATEVTEEEKERMRKRDEFFKKS